MNGLRAARSFTYNRYHVSIQKKRTVSKMRHAMPGSGMPRSADSMTRADEARRVPISRAQDDRGSGGDAGAIRPGRWTRAGRRPEPGADHGVPPGAAASSRRHQRHRRPRATRERERPARDRRRRAPPGVSPPGGGWTAGRSVVGGDAPHRPLSDPHPRHLLRHHSEAGSAWAMLPQKVPRVRIG